MKAPEALPKLNIPDGEPLEVKGVSFAYPGCEPTFQNLTFSAKPGDIIGITGPVACGKSTLGRMFLCEEPYSGSIRLGNRELSGLTAREISERIGYLGHDPELWNDTVKANVLCGETADPMAALSLTAMDKEVRSMEQGVNTMVGSSGVRLSAVRPNAWLWPGPWLIPVRC